MEIEITDELLDQLATLSRLEIMDGEREGLKNDLARILGYVSELESVPTDGIEPTYQVFDHKMPLRDDEVEAPLINREGLLKMAPATKGPEILVKKVL